MKKLFSIFSILFILGCFTVIYGQTTKRIAIIEDQNGVITEVENLDVWGISKHFYMPNNKIGVRTSTFNFAIPLDNVISIKNNGEVQGKWKTQAFDINYYWRGEERRLTGEISGNFIGKSDFGEFSTEIKNLKQLRFNQVSEKSKQKEEFHPDGYFIVRDGEKMEFRDLRRSYWGNRTVREVIQRELIQPNYYREVKQQYYEHTKNIAFNRGESASVLEFQAIKSIEFGDEVKISEQGNNFIITLKNGKSTQGKNSSGVGYEGLYGFTGCIEKGEFFIHKTDLKAIHFY
jgi:hypothetical protein